jgi:hypothetical protein
MPVRPLALFLILWLTTSVHSEELSVGVATADITPPRGYRMAGYFVERVNTGTHDPLLAKCIVFRQGDRKAALVFCDLISITRDVSDRARARASEKTGIPADKIAVAATHSHTGPLYAGVLRDRFHRKAVAREGNDPQEAVDYPALLVEKISGTIVRAHESAAPAQLAAGVAKESSLSFNRRFHMKDGTVRFNPGQKNPDIVRVAGPTDPDIGLVLVRSQDGRKPVALLSVFALHLDTVGGTQYAADYPFYLETVLRKELGPDLVSLFGAGTCGDINHIDVTTRERASTSAIGVQLGTTIIGSLNRLAAIAEPSLAVASARVEVPLQQPTPSQVEDAKAKIEKVGKGEIPFLEEVNAVKVLDLVENYSAPTTALEVQAFRLSPDVAIVTLPGEVFVEHGMAIKRASPFKTTLVIELANSAPAYVPTKKAFAEGSYEIVNSRVKPGGGEQLVETANQLLQKLGTKNNR